MNKFELQNAAEAVDAKILADVKVKKTLGAGPYPWYDFTAVRRYAAFAVVFQVTQDGEKHNVVLGCRVLNDDLEWAVWCGDAFLEGRNKSTATIEVPPGVTMPSDYLTQIDSREGVLAKPKNKCTFWDDQRCDHSDAVYAHLAAHPELIEELEMLWRATGFGVSDNTVAHAWSAPRAHLFRLPVLLMGDRGAGKTFLSRELASEVNAEFFELGLHAETKASTMLGRMVLNAEGKFAWVDGPVTRAFRTAKRGKKALLLLDELLRAPQEQLSALLTAFSPTKAGTYRLATGRVTGYDEDGVGVEEVIEAPIENIAVIATTNVGAEYAVCDIDPALQERFFLVKMDTEEATLKAVLLAICERKKFNSNLAERMVRFWQGMQALVTNGALPRAPTLRVLSRSLERIRKPDDLKASVVAESLQWVDLDCNGQVVPQHLTNIEKAAVAAGL